MGFIIILGGSLLLRRGLRARDGRRASRMWVAGDSLLDCYFFLFWSLERGGEEKGVAELARVWARAVVFREFDVHEVGDDAGEHRSDDDPEKKVNLDEPALHLPLELPSRILELVCAVGEHRRLVVNVLDAGGRGRRSSASARARARERGVSRGCGAHAPVRVSERELYVLLHDARHRVDLTLQRRGVCGDVVRVRRAATRAHTRIAFYRVRTCTLAILSIDFKSLNSSQSDLRMLPAFELSPFGGHDNAASANRSSLRSATRGCGAARVKDGAARCRRRGAAGAAPNAHLLLEHAEDAARRAVRRRINVARRVTL